ncbi:hypothetical protein M433DRAFT_226226 [Acidomyces richmondensis BFW]|nr:MAG: hypothetical protein FE78DRAFT_375862 [Acidomyces sp. 'richmondensis']KYG46022.1 hypothetical protein M433DRAFT_226226 [Acidomyces richmondensis BFW]
MVERWFLGRETMGEAPHEVHSYLTNLRTELLEERASIRMMKKQARRHQTLLQREAMGHGVVDSDRVERTGFAHPLLQTSAHRFHRRPVDSAIRLIRLSTLPYKSVRGLKRNTGPSFSLPPTVPKNRRDASGSSHPAKLARQPHCIYLLSQHQ